VRGRGRTVCKYFTDAGVYEAHIPGACQRIVMDALHSKSRSCIYLGNVAMLTVCCIRRVNTPDQTEGCLPPHPAWNWLYPPENFLNFALENVHFSRLDSKWQTILQSSCKFSALLARSNIRFMTSLGVTFYISALEMLLLTYLLTYLLYTVREFTRQDVATRSRRRVRGVHCDLRNLKTVCCVSTKLGSKRTRL